MSKVNILSHAVDYIRNLQIVLGEDPDADEMNMTDDDYEDDDNSNSNDANSLIKAAASLIKDDPSLLDDTASMTSSLPSPAVNNYPTLASSTHQVNTSQNIGSTVIPNSLESIPALTSPAPLYAPPLTPLSPNTPHYYPTLHPHNINNQTVTNAYYRTTSVAHQQSHNRFLTQQQTQNRFCQQQPDRPSSYESGYESTATGGFSDVDNSLAKGLLTSLYSDLTPTEVKGHPNHLIQNHHMFSEVKGYDIHQSANNYLSTTSPHLPSLLSPQQSPVNLHHSPMPGDMPPVTSSYLLPLTNANNKASFPGNQSINHKSAGRNLLVDSSGEEDDLLDAIAEWQQE